MKKCSKLMWALKTMLLVAVLAFLFKGDDVLAGEYEPYEGSPYTLRYDQTEEGIVITGYRGNSKNVKLVLPSEIDGVPVVEIGNYAFNYSYFTEELVIPNSVKMIGMQAFYDSDFTGELVIPDSVTSIGYQAFAYNYDLESLVLSANLKEIGDEAFQYCYFTNQLVIPDSVEYIGKSAFDSCCFTGELVLPDSITTIGKHAFAYNDFTSIVANLNESVTFGVLPFMSCTEIKEIKFLYKPYGLQELLGLNHHTYTEVDVYYPKYVDGWDEAILGYNPNAPGCTYEIVNWNEYEPSVVPFIQRMYQVALDRDADEDGLRVWVDNLLSGNKTGAEVAYCFIFSDEFKAKNYCDEHYVMQLYKAFLGREYDEGGLKLWLEVMEKGSAREAVFNGFSQSNEFKGICENYGIELGAPIEEPKYGTVPTGPCIVDGKEDGVISFIKRLYKICLDREADEYGLREWSGRLCLHECTGATAAYGFIFSPEFVNKNHSDSDYVEYLYEAFMGRASDPSGKALWLELLNNGEMNREDVFNGFAYSDEFTKICEEYGIVAH